MTRNVRDFSQDVCTLHAFISRASIRDVKDSRDVTSSHTLLHSHNAEIQAIEELREVMPRSGFRKQPPETIEDESGAAVPNVSLVPLGFLLVGPQIGFESKGISVDRTYCFCVRVHLLKTAP